MVFGWDLVPNERNSLLKWQNPLTRHTLQHLRGPISQTAKVPRPPPPEAQLRTENHPAPHIPLPPLPLPLPLCTALRLRATLGNIGTCLVL